jgi:hypothetical protein
MLRKAIVFPSRVKMMLAFTRFRDENPQFSSMSLNHRVITPNTVIQFLGPDDINEKLRGSTFHEVVIVEKMWLTQEEINNLQLTVVPTGGSFRTLK